jgi:hypothetical protein
MIDSSKDILAKIAADYRAKWNVSTAELLEKHSKRPGPKKKAAEPAPSRKKSLTLRGWPNESTD